MIWESNRFTSAKVEVVVDSLWHRFTDLATTLRQNPGRRQCMAGQDFVIFLLISKFLAGQTLAEGTRKARKRVNQV
jgi:hypothetical protein